MLDDGNFVLEDRYCSNIWQTQTWGNTGAAFQVTDSGGLQIEDGTKIVWHN